MPAEINYSVSRDKETIFEEIKTAFPDGEYDTLDGLTVEYPDYWFNLRASNTEPLMRLNIEAESKTKLDEVLGMLTKLIT
jgi:phosphomannomutase